ncbi:MAG TPA: adenylate/guanylate cyclase domain-containing protein [Gaiellaceae bacterium]|nr:adenylate/guanylate cyclase domain-containing protein [Gaiellaceae bacterium]
MTDRGSDDARVVELTGKLRELRARQTAVAEVLQDLAQSRMRLQPILDRIANAATSLCRSDYSLIHLNDGELLYAQANVGIPQEVMEYERLHPVELGVQTLAGRVAMTRRPAHIPDVVVDPDYDYPGRKMAEVRSMLGLPVLIEDELVGVIQVGRREVRPFDSDEIDLMATFASQCAIAIGNAKLFETVERQRVQLARFVSPEIGALLSSEDSSRLLAGHRAFITVVYFDLRGFTAFAETAEPEELIEVVREYHQAVGGLVTAHKGTLEHFAGDGLMVFFNDPAPLPDHEFHAAKLAVAMRKRVGELAAAWSKRGHELGLGAGIAAGHATLGQIGFEGRHDYGVLGTVTNLAARLSDAAATGQILLNKRAYAALEDRVETQPAAELEMKGFTHAVRAYELIRLLPRRPADDASLSGRSGP